MVSTMTYRLSSRRFLQELFLDLNFDELIHDSVEILKEKTFDDRSNIFHTETSCYISICI